jgi:lipopolysaccharide/colanic/teichoic acid biosynthesis glycosyltransferase
VKMIERAESTAEPAAMPAVRVSLAALLGVLALGAIALGVAADAPGAMVAAVAFGIASAGVAKPRRNGRAAVSETPVVVYDERELDALGRHELNRARRYEHPVTLVSLSLAASGTDILRAAERISACLRESDLLGHERARLFIVLPQTKPEAVDAFVNRAVAALGDELSGKGRLGAASFPDEEVTWVGLKARAVEREEPLRDTGGTDGDPGSRDGAANGRILRVRRMPGRLRRVADLAILVMTAPLTIPLGLLLALAVKIDSRGPVLIRQPRVGLGGRRFDLLKLRTMVKDADGLKDGLSHLNTLSWPDFKIPGDPRVTRVGRLLRRTSLDELPQLWNMLRGDVTLVGPRPCSVPVGKYELWQTERLEAMPGLFGRWQAEGRGKVSFADRCRMDIGQIKRQAPADELRLALRTLWALAVGRGAT